MNKTLVLLAALLSTPALAAEPGPAQETAKLQAPVEVEAHLAGDSARVKVTFLAPAEEVELRLGGADGLQVRGEATPIQHGRYQRGQQVELVVGFTPGAGQSHLAVFVSGSFAGQRLSSARSFAVGQRSAEQLAADRAGVKVDRRGQRVRVMQASPE